MNNENQIHNPREQDPDLNQQPPISEQDADASAESPAVEAADESMEPIDSDPGVTTDSPEIITSVPEGLQATPKPDLKVVPEVIESTPWSAQDQAVSEESQTSVGNASSQAGLSAIKNRIGGPESKPQAKEEEEPEE